MSSQEIVYFELNNWFGGRDYPNKDGRFGDKFKKYTDENIGTI